MPGIEYLEYLELLKKSPPKLLPSPMTYEERIERAVALFKSGYNCSQAVVAAFADIYGFTEEQAFRMSASFGGGIGRMQHRC